ncbi:MAG: hypothetical protein IH606_00775 [Burkholderiales bacterium]|nr:hypothetical protein [Burkholderiales bacterium]
MNWNNRIDDEIGNLPPDAFGQYDEPIEVDDQWLRTADRKDQLSAMRAWFIARYSDPANVLESRFSGIVHDGAIRELVEEIRSKRDDLCAPVKSASN